MFVCLDVASLLSSMPNLQFCQSGIFRFLLSGLTMPLSLFFFHTDYTLLLLFLAFYRANVKLNKIK